LALPTHGLLQNHPLLSFILAEQNFMATNIDANVLRLSVSPLQRGQFLLLLKKAASL
jgi:hypothetical protein